MRVTSAAGTDLTARLAGAFRAGSSGVTTEPGTIAHWPGGLCLAFPAAHCVEGVVVLAPGDINLTFKTYVREPVTLRIEDDHVVAIEGTGVDADLFRSYLAAFGDRESYAVSHVGFGMNRNAPLGLPRALRQGADQRHRGARVRRQLPLLDRRERERRALHGGPLRPADARLHGRPRRPRRGGRGRAAGRAGLS